MTDDETDPFELHARRFLSRLRHVMDRFFYSADDLDDLIQKTNRVWWQILAAWSWASSHLQNPAAREICDALDACTKGSPLHELRRSPDEIARWSRSVSDFTKRLGVQPNEAAFLFTTAGVALVGSGLLKVAQETGAPLDDVLRVAEKLLQTRSDESSLSKPENAISSPVVE